jgi:hypothetical protein
MREDVGLDLISDGPPARREICVATGVGKFRRAVQGDPAHQLGGHIVLRLAASLPDALVGFAPDRRGALGDLTMGHSRRGSRSLRRVWSNMESSTAPNTSFWRWSNAPLPIRTGRAPA